eukprot:2503996-Pleurochrysis_carterae.AAC.1
MACSGAEHAAFTCSTRSGGASGRCSSGSPSTYLQLSHSPDACFSQNRRVRAMRTAASPWRAL